MARIHPHHPIIHLDAKSQFLQVDPMKLQTVLSKRKLLSFTAFHGTLSRIFESEALEVLHLAKRRCLQMS